jgi:acetolactate synthase I/II/III large subunit
VIIAMRMRVADYLTNALYEAGGKTVFLITGGMIMHLTDALLVHGRQRWVCCHHEQAAVMAADVYGRFTGSLGVAYVTAGPGALNTMTGVVGAYVDSAPCVIVAGQSKVSQAKVVGPRQFALQGFSTLPLFEKVTKYAAMLDDVATVRYKVERAIFEARSGRPGPVWIECPIDVQGATFDPDDFEGFSHSSLLPEPSGLAGTIERIAGILEKSERPCLLAGAGVRSADAVDLLRAFVHATDVPVITSRLGLDLFGFEDAQFVGHPGTYGDRPANFAVQNCDVLLTIGCRMGIGLTGHDFGGFAPSAIKIMVDIDRDELTKPSVVPDIPVLLDARLFLEGLQARLAGRSLGSRRWVERTRAWKARYPVDVPEYADERDGINSYHFMRLFSERLPADSVVVVDTGSCFHVHAQAFKVKEGQRHIITGGLSTMGFMPAVMGAAVANDGQDVYCITGDGSIQMHLQELQTIKHSGLPVKLVVLNNRGYLLIRLTQANFMDGRLIGEGPETGVSFPDMRKVAESYDLRYIRADDAGALDARMEELIAYDGPVVFEVMTPAEQLLVPRVASKQLPDGTMVSMPYDDMFPFLPRDEYETNVTNA